MVYIIVKHEQYPQFVNKFIDIVAMPYRELDGNITVCQRRIFSHVNVQYLEMLESSMRSIKHPSSGTQPRLIVRMELTMDKTSC